MELKDKTKRGAKEFPLIPFDLIDHLETIFPLKLPTLTESDREIGVRIGVQKVIDRLKLEHKRQVDG